MTGISNGTEEHDTVWASLTLLLRFLLAVFVVSVAGVYLVDYQLLDPLPGELDDAGREFLPVLSYSQIDIEHAKSRLGLEAADANVERFKVLPAEIDDYTRVPIRRITLLVCRGDPIQAGCGPGDSSALPFRVDRVVHVDRGGGIDTWDFIFVPDTEQVGSLRFVFRSNGGRAFGASASGGFVLGAQEQAAGGLVSKNRVAGIEGFDGSSLEETLSQAADIEDRDWWEQAPGGLVEFRSNLLGRAASGSFLPQEAADLWSAALKVLRAFAVVGVVLGFLASLISISDAGASLLGQLRRVSPGWATAVGVVVGCVATVGYLLHIGADAEQAALASADSALADVIGGSLERVEERAAREGVELRGVEALHDTIPGTSSLEVARAEVPTTRATGGITTVQGPLAIFARDARDRLWRIETQASVAVRVYRGPTAVPVEVDLEAIRIFPAG